MNIDSRIVCVWTDGCHVRIKNRPIPRAKQRPLSRAGILPLGGGPKVCVYFVRLNVVLRNNNHTINAASDGGCCGSDGKVLQLTTFLAVVAFGFVAEWVGGWLDGWMFLTDRADG